MSLRLASLVLPTVTVTVLLSACGGSSSGGGDGGGTVGTDPPVGQWVRSGENAGGVRLVDVVATPDDDVLVIGRFADTLTLSAGQPDEQILTPEPEATDTVFVARYRADGTLASAASGGALQNFQNGVGGVSPDGSFTVRGPGAGPPALALPVDAIGHVARLDPTGAPVWGSAVAGPGSVTFSAFETFADGSVVISGVFQDSVTFGVGEPNETRLATSGLPGEIFLARYTPDGTLAWVERAIQGAYLPNIFVRASADGAILVFGQLENRVTFAPGSPEAFELPMGGDGYLARFEADGTLAWAQGVTHDFGRSSFVDVRGLANGHVAVTGAFSGIGTFGLTESATLHAIGSDFPGRTQYDDWFTLELDADGGLVWAAADGGAAGDRPAMLARLGDDTVVLGGFVGEVVWGPGTPGEVTLTPEENAESLLGAYRGDGRLVWARRAPAGLSGRLAVTSSGDLYVAGTFDGTHAFFADEPGAITLASAGGDDLFLARLAP